ncbi:MAG TPA: O-methyltransferase [Bacillota bacterium]|nr:O-methyltransferase [Bacillota bacterium]
MKTSMNDYLEQILPVSADWIREMEREAKEDNIPIMDKVSMQFVNQIIRLTEPKQILEIGTAIGYSALRMLDAFPSATITTIERDEERYHRAKELIEERGKVSNIQLMYGDALEVLTSLQTTGNEFDVAFIDAAKGQYQSFFEQVDPMVRAGGIVISDNVLFRGLVASEEEVDKKYRSLVKKLRLYNAWLMNHSNYESSIIPIGDGIALSIKKQQ